METKTPLSGHESGNLLTANQAASFLGVRPQTLATWRCAKRYAIPFLKVGSMVRYRRTDLEAWLASRTVTSKDLD
jgi:excisionase family DNA binding protein